MLDESFGYDADDTKSGHAPSQVEFETKDRNDIKLKLEFAALEVEIKLSPKLKGTKVTKDVIAVGNPKGNRGHFTFLGGFVSVSFLRF